MSDDLSAAALIQSASMGDQVAIASLLTDHLPRLRAFVRLRVGPRLRLKESQSDLVQSVCREVLEDLDGFEYRGEAQFRGWLFQMALRKIIDKDRFYGSQKRDAAREVDGARELLDCYQSLSTPSQHLMEREQVEAFEKVFDQLPPDYREVITLARVVGLPHKEIAGQMGRKEPAVRVLLHRAIARLGVLLDEAGGAVD